MAINSKPRNWPGFFLIVGIFILWELLDQFTLGGGLFLPPPSRIMVAWFSLSHNGELPVATLNTLERCFAGYFIAVIIAIPLGTAMGSSSRIYNLLEPLVESLRPIPSAAIIPVAILFFGIEDSMKISVVVYGCLWPILLNTIHGIHTTDSVLIDTGRTFGLKGIELLQKIVLPAALPSIVTGCRISLAIALILSITVEMIGGGPGLGYLILDFERSFRYPEMYAGILTLGLVGYGINWGISNLDRRFLAWSKTATDRLL